MIHEKERLLISEYIDAELDVALEKKLFAHLSGCDSCRQFLRHSLKLRYDLQNEPDQILATSNAGLSPRPNRTGFMKSSSTVNPEVGSSFAAARNQKRSQSLIETIGQIWQSTISLSYGFAAFAFSAALAIGILVATIQQASNDHSLTSEPNREYVAVLPSVMVVGHK